MTSILWLNVLLMAVFFGLWVGIPAWLVVKRPDRRTRIALAPGRYRVAAAPDHASEPAYRRVA